MRVDEARGKLVIIGGGEDKEGDCEILKEFVRLAGGAKAHVVVMTVATDEPKEAAAEYKAVFKRLGIDEVVAVDVSQRKDAHAEEALAAIERATGVFFTGGDQLHITSLLGGSGMHELLHNRHKEGLLIGGTSAGAAMMSNSMIIGGESQSNSRFGGIEIGPGMNFVKNACIDTHFNQRGRIGRLITAVAHYPQDLGFGVNENTAMVVDGREFEVIGENSVTVVGAGAITYTNVPDIGKGENLSLWDITIHVLSAKHRFNLELRAPIDNTAETNNVERGKAARANKGRRNED